MVFSPILGSAAARTSPQRMAAETSATAVRQDTDGLARRSAAPARTEMDWASKRCERFRT
jgi:hypothetical protein